MAKHLQSGDKRADRLNSILYPTRRTALSLAIAVALGMPGMVHAQAAPAAAGELEEIVVTGIRAGIQSAIATKQEAMSIVESISAEDIGKLPDTSIAESISRLPGLTSQRAEGRASAISLRGTDPGFTSALLNGREQATTGDNRNVEFDQYPSELISQVVVYKTPDSKLIGQGLAGTIDLRTVRPLDYGKQAIVLNLRGEKNSNDNLGADSDDTGYRASFSYIDQFMDGKLGFAFGYAHLDSPVATRGFGTYEPWNASGGPGTTDCGGVVNGCVTNPDVAAGNYTTGGMKVRADMGSTERDGLMASLQFTPNDFYTGVIDLYYSTMDQTNNARALEVGTGCYPATCFSGDVGKFPLGTVFGYSDTTVKNGAVVAGTANTISPLVRNFLFTTEDEILATGWRNEITLNDEWSLMADISYSKANRDQLQFEVEAQLPFAATAPAIPVDTGTFRLRGNSGMPSLSFTRDYTDPTQIRVGNTVYGSGYSKQPQTEDELTSFRLDATRDADMWWFRSVLFGLNYSDRSKDKEQGETGLSTKLGQRYLIDQRFLLAPTNLNYADAGRALAFNVRPVLNEYFNPIVFGRPDQPGYSYLAGKFWTVTEKISTAYVRGELDHEISDTVRLKGNIGLQAIYTDQSSDAFRVDTSPGQNNAVTGITDGKTYTDWLPQINLAFLLPDSQAVRLGLAKEQARPRMDQLKAAQESGYNFTTGEPGGSGGNPRLDPWEAWALDVSYEKYFYENKGYVSAAAFYKDLDTYIYNQTNDGFDFTDLCATTPPELFPGGNQQCTGRFSQPVNGNGGYLWGMEFAASVPFDLFSDALDGFGAIVSYSYTDSDIAIQGSISSVATQNIPLPGLSQDVWNATLYYEKYGFGARIATRYRSEYIGEVANFANERALRYVDADMITDAQLSYSFSGNAFEGLQVLFQVNNLTNEPYIAYSENKQRVLDYQEYGTQYLLGLNYKFR